MPKGLRRSHRISKGDLWSDQFGALHESDKRVFFKIRGSMEDSTLDFLQPCFQAFSNSVQWFFSWFYRTGSESCRVTFFLACDMSGTHAHAPANRTCTWWDWVAAPTSTPPPSPPHTGWEWQSHSTRLATSHQGGGAKKKWNLGDDFKFPDWIHRHYNKPHIARGSSLP